MQTDGAFARLGGGDLASIGICCSWEWSELRTAEWLPVRGGGIASNTTLCSIRRDRPSLRTPRVSNLIPGNHVPMPTDGEQGGVTCPAGKEKWNSTGFDSAHPERFDSLLTARRTRVGESGPLL